MTRTTVIVIDTDPLISTEAGGHWWDVAVPEVSVRPQVNAARKDYEESGRCRALAIESAQPLTLALASRKRREGVPALG